MAATTTSETHSSPLPRRRTDPPHCGGACSVCRTSPRPGAIPHGGVLMRGARSQASVKPLLEHVTSPPATQWSHTGILVPGRIVFAPQPNPERTRHVNQHISPSGVHIAIPNADGTEGVDPWQTSPYAVRVPWHTRWRHPGVSMSFCAVHVPRRASCPVREQHLFPEGAAVQVGHVTR